MDRRDVGPPACPVYAVHRAPSPPELAGLWDGPAWGRAPVARIARFHARSSSHRPVTEFKLLHSAASIHALFRVPDRYVRCVHTAFESDTYKDSCVELFVQPSGAGGYFALEVNCGGALSLRFIEDWTRVANRFAKWTPVDPSLAGRLAVSHSMPAVVEPEIADPIDWWVELACPLAVLEAYRGPLAPPAGCRWRANAFKCGDETSHPHWASWAPIGEALNFHQPECFGVLEFMEGAP